MGGTGKTPLVIELNRKLRNEYKTVFIKKKYYNQDDEQRLLKFNGNLICEKNRSKALQKAADLDYELALIDDGLQDKKIKYDLSIVCFDGLVGIGNGLILPSGPLRESLNNLKYYDAVVINNGTRNNDLIKLIKKNNENINLFFGEYIISSEKKYDLNKNYFAFCGIGNPNSFLKTLNSNKFNISEFISFPDHYNFSKEEITNIKKTAEKKNLSIITTEKDYLRLNGVDKSGIEYLKINLKIQNENEFFIYINSCL